MSQTQTQNQSLAQLYDKVRQALFKLAYDARRSLDMKPLALYAFDDLKRSLDTALEKIDEYCKYIQRAREAWGILVGYVYSGELIEEVKELLNQMQKICRE